MIEWRIIDKFITSLIYYDGIESLYDKTNNLIEISIEELVFCLFVAFQGNTFDNTVKDLIKSLENKLKESKDV